MRINENLLCCLVVESGCAAARVEMDGFILEREKTQELLGTLRRRASFDLGCPADQLGHTILAVHDDAGPDMPKQVGVTGCNKRATYTMEYLPSRWGPMFNTETGGAWTPRGSRIRRRGGRGGRGALCAGARVRSKDRVGSSL